MTTTVDGASADTNNGDTRTLATAAHGDIGLTYLTMWRVQILERLAPKPGDATAEECTRAALTASVYKLGERVFDDADRKDLAALDLDVDIDELRTFALLFLEMNDLPELTMTPVAPDGQPLPAPAETRSENADGIDKDLLDRVKAWCVKSQDDLHRYTRIPGLQLADLAPLPSGFHDSVSRIFEATRGFDFALRSVRGLQFPALHLVDEVSKLGAALEPMRSMRDLRGADLLSPGIRIPQIDMPTLADLQPEPSHRMQDALEAMAAENKERVEARARRQAKEDQDRERTAAAAEDTAASLARIETMYRASLEMTTNLKALGEATQDLMQQQMHMAGDAQRQALTASEKNTREAIAASEKHTRQQLRWAIVIAVVGWGLALVTGIAQVYLAYRALPPEPTPVVQEAPSNAGVP